MQRTDHRYVLEGKHSLEYDLKHRKWLEFRKYSCTDQRNGCSDMLYSDCILYSVCILVDIRYTDLRGSCLCMYKQRYHRGHCYHMDLDRTDCTAVLALIFQLSQCTE